MLTHKILIHIFIYNESACLVTSVLCISIYKESTCLVVVVIYLQEVGLPSGLENNYTYEALACLMLVVRCWQARHLGTPTEAQQEVIENIILEETYPAR